MIILKSMRIKHFIIFSILLSLIGWSCQRSKTNFETIIPAPNQELRLYLAINDGEIYYLVKKEEIIIGWSRLNVFPNSGSDSVKVWKQIFTRTGNDLIELIDDGLDKVVCPDDLCNEAEVGFQSDSKKKYTFYVQFNISDNLVAFRYKLPADKKMELPREVTEVVLHTNSGPWEMKRDTSVRHDQIDLDPLALPVTFISKKHYQINIFEVPVNRKILRLQKAPSDKDQYYLSDEEYISRDGYLYSSWKVIEIR